MSKPKEDVVIQEPPMEEFGKKHSCIKRTCLSGCGCFVLFLIAGLTLLNVATHRGEKNLKNIPPQVQTNIPLYDTQNVRSIKMIDGDERGKAVEIISYLPKIVISPLVVVTPEKFLDHPNTGPNAHFENIKTFLKKPISKPKDTYILGWTNLPAELSFIQDYYETELQKRHFTVETPTKTTSTVQILFHKNNIEGVVFAEDSSFQKDGTNIVSVTVTLEKP